jgi:DHA1 family bicyclomycin/chloramphenicol resistance-like MFS transporter
MPRILEQLSKCLVALTYTGFSMLCADLCLIGLPSKQPQDPRVKEGCSNSWWVFMGLTYALVYFSTDQYVPSLPQMEKDLGGSQSLMSGTVQMNLFVKATFGLLAAGLSDRIGRRPVVLFCTFLLSLASFCCACANQIEWFILARVLQGMGESIEPVVFAMARDHFKDPEERVRIIAAFQMIGFVGIAVAPVFGGVCAHFLDWRSYFFPWH